MRRWGSLVVLAVVWAIVPIAAPAAPVTSSPVAAAATQTSDGTTPTAAQPFRVQDDDTRLAFRGSWRYVWDVRSSGFSRRYTRVAGSYVASVFTGTGVALVAPLRVDGGFARITLDGVNVATVSLYASSPTTSAAVWSTTGLAGGVHTLKVTALGSHEPSSTGSVVSVDAVDVEGGRPYASPATGKLIQQTDWRLYRTGSWRGRESASSYGGSSMYSIARGQAVTVRFKGSSITWLGRKWSSQGRAEVLLDGRRVAIVGGADGSQRERVVLWAISGLRYGTHSVVIRNLGVPTDRSASLGTAVDVDAILVDGTPLFAPRPTPFSYPWRTYIVVDKSDFRLYWVKNGVLLKWYPIAHGKVGWTTPSRTWRIDAKYHTSPTSVYGPRKMRMFKQVGSSYVFSNYAIHGTNEEWVIGTRASHGCIRMYNRDVLELFPQVPLGTMVVTRD